MVKCRAFSLVETLCVMAILIALFAIAQPALVEARHSAARSVSAAHLRQLHVALKMYQIDYGGEGVYGTASAMGLPDFMMMYGPPADPADVVSGTAGIWKSPCGTHPGSPLSSKGTNNLSYYATDMQDEY
jgi:type II secretory pathway pseudopilin PulG